MPADVRNGDPKATDRIAEIERELQDKKRELDRGLRDSGAPRNAAEAIKRERRMKALTDGMQALATALALQRALASPELHEQERRLAKASPKKMKDFGRRPVKV